VQLSIIDQIFSQFWNYMAVSWLWIIPIGLALQLYGVAMFMRASLRDDQYRKMSWVKATGYAVMFVVGMPLVGQGLAVVLVGTAPFLASATNIISLLNRVFPVDQHVAVVSQPWGYVITLLFLAFYSIKVIRSLKGRSLIWRPLLQIFCVLIFSHLFFQIAVYAVLKLTL